MTLRSDIERAKELDAKATPGPWHEQYRSDGKVLDGVVCDNGEELIYGVEYVGTHFAGSDEDIQLVAHYRNLVPRLIAQMERMEGALRDIYALCNGYGDEPGQACNIAQSSLAALDKET